MDKQATRKRLALHENPADFILDNMKGMDAQDVRAMIIKMPPCEGPDVPEDQYWENLKPLSDEALQRYSMYQSLDPAREQQSFYQRMKLIIARIQLMLSRSWEYVPAPSLQTPAVVLTPFLLAHVACFVV